MPSRQQRPLTDKQQRFVEEYLVDLNATAACIRAGYSERNADKIGPELLGKTRVAKAIQEAQAKLALKVQVTQEMVVKGLLDEARGDGPDTNSKARVTAWTTLANHLGMLKQTHEHTGKGGKPIEVNARHDFDPNQYAGVFSEIGRALVSGGATLGPNGVLQPVDTPSSSSQATDLPES
jgi:hypothetical protein